MPSSSNQYVNIYHRQPAPESRSSGRLASLSPVAAFCLRRQRAQRVPSRPRNHHQCHHLIRASNNRALIVAIASLLLAAAYALRAGTRRARNSIRRPRGPSTATSGAIIITTRPPLRQSWHDERDVISGVPVGGILSRRINRNRGNHHSTYQTTDHLNLPPGAPQSLTRGHPYHQAHERPRPSIERRGRRIISP